MTGGPAGTESHPVSGGSIDVAGWSDIGRFRSENQDRIRTGVGPAGVILVLADGMGGGVGGAEAAEAAVTAAMTALEGGGPLPGAVAAATAAVAEVRAGFGGGMVGTTLVCAVAGAEQITVLNVGDSRAYLCAGDGSLQALTRDHSLPGDLVAAGTMSREEARRDPRRNMLTRAVNGDPVTADVFAAAWRDGDTLVLCSDGVWEALDEAAAGRIWSAPGLADAAADACRAALDAGSHDNVSVLLARLGRRDG